MKGSRHAPYRSEALEVLHKTVVGLHRVGVIDDATMRRFDDGCLISTTKASGDKPPRPKKRSTFLPPTAK
jgi:DNA-binding transcriptional regulator YiaG